MNLNKIINDQKPILSIVGGSKVSTKLPLLENMIQISDYFNFQEVSLIIFACSKLLYRFFLSENLIDETKKLVKLAEAKNTKIIYPIDCIASDSIEGLPQLKDSFDS